MYYILEDLELLETYKDIFVGNADTVRYSLDKTKCIVESKELINELGQPILLKDASSIMGTTEWADNSLEN